MARRPKQQEVPRNDFRLTAGTKVANFITSNRFVDIIEGPFGSGKTRAMCMRIGRHAQEQSPSPIDGVRYTRFALIRNTTPDLKRSTIRTWRECWPEKKYGEIRTGSPMGHKLAYSWGGGAVNCEIDFIGLDKDDDYRKLMSTEYTGVAFDEIQFIPKSLIDAARGRLRYPPREHCDPSTEDHLGRRRPTWRGVIAATNTPPEDHWLPMMTGRVEMLPGMRDDEIAALQWPDDWGYYLQPAALIERMDKHGQVIGYDVNPDAENLENLPPDYYDKLIAANTKSWIDNFLMCRVVLVSDGSAVYPMFRRETHVASEPLIPKKGYEVYCGLDFGRSPAAIFLQVINNRVFWQHELIGANEGAAVFAPRLKRFFRENYPDHSIGECRFFGDPKGQDKGQADERTAYDIFAAHGMHVRAPPGLKLNYIDTRVQAITSLLNDMTDGLPRFVSSPKCRTLNVGMGGRYCNEKDDTGELKPTKNRYSHVCFVAGTPVAVPGGTVPVERLAVGDLVNTPSGAKPVVAIGSRPCDILELLFSNEVSLRCTPDHPFWTKRGWISASELTGLDICFAQASSPRSAAEPSIRSLSLAGLGSIAKAVVATITTRAAGGCMSLCGLPTLVTYPPDMMSTISTRIHQTTIQKTLNACWSQITTSIIWQGLAGSISRKLRWRLQEQQCLASVEAIQSGHLKFVWPQGMLLQQKLRQRRYRCLSVIDAVSLINQNLEAMTAPASVPRIVSAPPVASVVTTMRIALASFAGALLGGTSIPKHRPVRLVARALSTPVEVYNIEVAEAHCYYAGGILVSNCNAAEYAAIGIGEGRRAIGLKPLGDMRPVQTRRPKNPRRGQM